MCIKFLFDQNLSYRLVSKLEKEYPDSKHIGSLNLDKASDMDIWKYAKENDFTIVTKDSDFNELSMLYNFPPHVIWLRSGNSSIKSSYNLIIKHQEQINNIISENEIGIIEIN